MRPKKPVSRHETRSSYSEWVGKGFARTRANYGEAGGST